MCGSLLVALCTITDCADQRILLSSLVSPTASFNCNPAERPYGRLIDHMIFPVGARWRQRLSPLHIDVAQSRVRSHGDAEPQRRRRLGGRRSSVKRFLLSTPIERSSYSGHRASASDAAGLLFLAGRVSEMHRTRTGDLHPSVKTVT